MCELRILRLLPSLQGTRICSSLAFVLQRLHSCGLNTTPTSTTFIKYARQSIASALFRAVYRVEPELSGLSGPKEIVRVMESPYNRKDEYY